MSDIRVQNTKNNLIAALLSCLEDESFHKLKVKDIIDSITASNFFGSLQAADLGIYHLTKDGGFDFSVFENPLVKKIMDKSNDSILNHLDKQGSEHCVKIPHIFGRPNMKGEELYITPNKEVSMSKDNLSGGERTRWLNFKTQEEAENCFNLFFSKREFFGFCVSVFSNQK